MEPVWGFGLSERARELTGGLFKAADVAKKFGIKYGRLKEWLKHIPPSVEQAEGPGTRNIFTRSDLYKLFLFRELIEKGGLERTRAAAVVSALDKDGLIKFSSTLLTRRFSTYNLNPDGGILKIQLTIDMGALKEQVDKLLG
jgi:hypothetical protein